MPIRMPFISNLNYYTKTCVFKELTFQVEIQDMQTNIYKTNQKGSGKNYVVCYWRSEVLSTVEGGGGTRWVGLCGWSCRKE